MDVEAGHGVDAGGRRSLEKEVGLERPEVAEVEDRAEVDVEAVRALTREDEAARAERVDRLCGKRPVLRDRVLADVARRARQVLRQQVRAVLVDAGHRIELLAVPRLVAQVLDLPGVVEEQVVGAGVGQTRGELELVGDVRLGIVVVVNVDLVEHVVAELVEVRAARRLLERYVVGDDRDRAGVVRAHERIQVRAVCDGILRDFGSFAVGGHRLHLTGWGQRESGNRA